MKRRGLTPSQAAELLRASNALPPTSRAAFFAAVDARLCSLPHRLTDDDVQSAIVTVLADASITTTHCFVCDAQQEADMARPYLKFDIRTGRPIEDDDGVLRDGQRLYVPLMMKDGMSDVQRAIAEDKAARRGFDDSACRHQLGPISYDRSAAQAAYADATRALSEAWRTPADVADRRKRKVQARDPFGRETGTEEWEEEDARPTHDAAAGRRAKQAAYDAYVRDLTDGWRSDAAPPTGFGEREMRGAKAGDQCTINGAPGHLNARLECVPDHRDAAPTVPRTMDAAEARRIKKAAYDAMVAEMCGAWRD